MGTTEILDFLEENKDKWFRTYQLREQLKERCGATILKKLRYWKLVEWRICKGMMGGNLAYEYKWKKIEED